MFQTKIHFAIRSYASLVRAVKFILSSSIVLFAVVSNVSAQSVQSCVYNEFGPGCLDFTVTNHEQNIGYIEFQVTYTGTGTLKQITSIQAVYADMNSAGVPIPPGGTPTNYAPKATVVATSSLGSISGTGINLFITGLDFTFVTQSGVPYKVSNFTTVTENSTLVPLVRVSNAQTSINFNCEDGGLISNPNHCHYRPTSMYEFYGSTPIGTIPEIDGGQLPKLILLLAGLYFVSRRPSKSSRDTL